jgi:hypothetical protein
MLDTEAMDMLQVEEPQQESTPQAAAATQQMDPKSENFRILREKAERLERERDEALRQLQEKQAISNQAASQPEDVELTIGDSELAEGKHVRQVQRELKDLRKQLKHYQQQSAASQAEALIKARFPDFDDVVTKEAVAALREEFPEVAQGIATNPDIYTQAASAYKLIKRMSMNQATSAQDALEHATAQKNSHKPKPTASISPQQGDSPMSKANAFANGLTDELKKQLIKEMEESRRRV